MKGKRTALVLGAGASRCYEDGVGIMPMQSDILGSFFLPIEVSSGLGAPGLAFNSGMKHSFRLGRLLQEKYKIPDDPKDKLGFWKTLQKTQTLETLYAELEGDSAFQE